MPDAEPRLPLLAIHTNVVVSGLLIRKGWPFAVLKAWQSNRVRLAISVTQFAELADVFQREHLYRKYEITLEQGRPPAFRDGTRRRFRWSHRPDNRGPPDDVVFIATAVEQGAEFLITGDRDLLEVVDAAGSVGVRIVTPASSAKNSISEGQQDAPMPTGGRLNRPLTFACPSNPRQSPSPLSPVPRLG